MQKFVKNKAESSPLCDLVEEICVFSLEVILKASTRIYITSHQNSNDLPLRAFLTRLLV